MSNSQHQGDPNNTDDTQAGLQTPPAARRAPPPAEQVERQMPQAKVYLDRSREFSTIHGEIFVGDAHYGVKAYQDGLPYSHTDELMIDLPEVQNDSKKRLKAEKLVNRAQKLLERARSTGDDDEGEDDEDGDGSTGATESTEPVNLNAWARGIADWPWQEITNAIARKYSKRVKDKHSALELLLQENAVTHAQLAKPYKAMIDRGYS